MSDVLIDVTRLVHRALQGLLPTGVDRVSLAYLAHFGPRAQAVVRWAGQFWLLSPRVSRLVFLRLMVPDAQPLAALPFIWQLVRGVVEAWPKRRALAGRFLFNTGHSGLETPEYATFVARSGVRPLFFVHDLIPMSHPEYCRAGESARHARRMHMVCAHAAGVITNSQDTLQILSAHAKAERWRLPLAAVAPLALGVKPAQRATRRPVESPYFVMLGTLEPRKNHMLIFQLWRRLAERLGAAAPKLIVIGRRGWEFENIVAMLERCEPLRACVREIPDCDDAALATWLQHAQALLFPSFAEGYGMPLLEALAAGVPVIASDLAVFREVAGEIPDYLDPLDGPAWLAAIEEYALPQHPRRVAQLERLKDFSVFTWPAHFAQVEGLMERLDA